MCIAKEYNKVTKPFFRKKPKVEKKWSIEKEYYLGVQVNLFTDQYTVAYFPCSKKGEEEAQNYYNSISRQWINYEQK